MSRFLVRRVLKNGDPEDAIRWLQKVLQTAYADGQSTCALWGVPVKERIQLTPKVAIVPFNDLPDSKQKQSMANIWLHGHGAFSSLSIFPLESALVAPERIKPFLQCPDNGTLPNLAAAVHELFSEITLPLTLVGPRVALEVAHWFTFDDSDLEEASILSGTHSQPFIEILPLSPLQYPILDPHEAVEIVQGYCALEGRTRNKVRMALQRLSQAQRRNNLGDRAVELSIALEALMGDNETSEMSHKIKVRSTRLIGGSEDNRKNNAALISKSYSIRSTLMHTGEVNFSKHNKVRGTEMSNLDVINGTIVVCVNLIKTIIKAQSIPTWPDFDIA